MGKKKGEEAGSRSVEIQAVPPHPSAPGAPGAGSGTLATLRGTQEVRAKPPSVLPHLPYSTGGLNAIRHGLLHEYPARLPQEESAAGTGTLPAYLLSRNRVL